MAAPYSTRHAAFGAAVKARREALGLTQEDAAFAANRMDRGYWSGIERGVKNPTLNHLHTVADTLRLPLSALIAAGEARSDVAD